MPIPRFLVLGTYSPSVTANLPENNPLPRPPQHLPHTYKDERTFHEIGPALFKDSTFSISSKDGKRIVDIIFDNDESIKLRTTRLQNIWKTHATNSIHLYSAFGGAATLSLAYGVYQLLHHHSIKYSLFFTAVFGLIAAFAKAEVEFAQEQLDKIPEPILNIQRGENINMFRNAILKEGFRGFLDNISMLCAEDRPHSTYFFTQAEKAFLITIHLKPKDVEGFYKQLLEHDLISIFNKLAESPSLGLESLCKDKPAGLVALLRTVPEP